jgi:hypothetical protein
VFWIGKYGFFRLFLEAQKKILALKGPASYGGEYTKVSWLEGNFSIGLPICPLRMWSNSDRTGNFWLPDGIFPVTVTG